MQPGGISGYYLQCTFTEQKSGEKQYPDRIEETELAAGKIGAKQKSRYRRNKEHCGRGAVDIFKNPDTCLSVTDVIDQQCRGSS